MFLNKMLSSAKIKYWSTELKIIAIIWFIRKTRLLIISFNHSITMFMNYKTNSTIIFQTKFFLTFVNKLNLKLIRTFIYLSQYRFRVFHRSEKFNIVFNAFSRLFIKKHNLIDVTINNLNVDAFNENVIAKTFIEINDKFRWKLIKKYEQDFA